MSGHDIVVDAGDIKLSGLLAEPAGTSAASPWCSRSRAAGCWPATSTARSTAPRHCSISGRRRVSPSGRSTGPATARAPTCPTNGIDILGQADLVHAALDTVRERARHRRRLLRGRPLLRAQARARDGRRRRCARQLLGIDGAGTGLRYAIDSRRPPPRRAGRTWPDVGARSSLPGRDVRRPARLPFGRVPTCQARRRRPGPRSLRSIAGDIRVPLRFTYGDHERLWPIDDAVARRPARPVHRLAPQSRP